MKVALLTMFSGLSPTYSLVNVAADQIRMLLQAGWSGSRSQIPSTGSPSSGTTTPPPPGRSTIPFLWRPTTSPKTL